MTVYIIYFIVLTLIFTADYCFYRSVFAHRRASKRQKKLFFAQSLLHGLIPALVSLGLNFHLFYIDDLFASILILIFGTLFLTKMVYLSSYLLLLLPFAKTKIGRVLHAVALVAAIYTFSTFGYGYFVGLKNIETQDISLSFEKLPDAFDGFKIVQISDLHLGGMAHHPNIIPTMVDKVNALDADLIVFTGDLVNARAAEITPTHIEQLSKLKARFGVYAVLGNHDYGKYNRWKTQVEEAQNFNQIIDSFAKLNWKLLNNESILLKKGGESIRLIGVENWGDQRIGLKGDLKKAVDTLPLAEDSTFSVLLSHNPKIWPQEVEKYPSIGLTLSGHTHAMQFSIAGFSPARWAYPHYAGLYKEANQYLYVNKGMGHTVFASRVGAYPEITSILLHN